MISQPNPVISLADRMKTWPMLAAHQLEEIKTVLLAFEERLNALDPKTGKSIFAHSVAAPGTHPFMPISPPVPIPAQPTPLPEPSVLPAPSYAQSYTFAGKSIFAPASKTPNQIAQDQATHPDVTRTPAQPTIFEPAKTI